MLLWVEKSPYCNILIRAGADVAVIDNYGMNTLAWARNKGDRHMVTAIVRAIARRIAEAAEEPDVPVASPLQAEVVAEEVYTSEVVEARPIAASEIIEWDVSEATPVLAVSLSM